MPKADIPDHLRCPINKCLFEDPVCTSDGQTYERKSIKKWIDEKQSDVKSPMTNLRLLHTGLCVNLHIIKEVKAFKATLVSPEKLLQALLNNDIKTLDSCSFIDEQITEDMVEKAILSNQLQSVQWLDKQGISYLKTDKLVFLAVEYGALEVTKWFFEQTPTHRGLHAGGKYTLLDYAIDVDTFQFLLQKGVSLMTNSLQPLSTLPLYCPTVPRINRSLETFKLLYAEKKKLKGKTDDDDSVDKLDYWNCVFALPLVFQWFWDQQTSADQISMLLEENSFGDTLLHHTGWKAKLEMFQTVLSIYKESVKKGLVPANLMEIQSLKGDTVLHSICYRPEPDVEFLKFMKQEMGSDAFCAGLAILNKNRYNAGEILLKQASNSTSKSLQTAMQFIIEHCPSERYFKVGNIEFMMPIFNNMMQLMVEKRINAEKEEKERKEIDLVKKGTKRRNDTKDDEKEQFDTCLSCKKLVKKLKT